VHPIGLGGVGNGRQLELLNDEIGAILFPDKVLGISRDHPGKCGPCGAVFGKVVSILFRTFFRGRSSGSPHVVPVWQ
jgi:hypothetical protein